MRVACDEGVPRPLVRRLSALGVDVSPPAQSWYGRSNGRLIAAVASAGFDALLSNDKNLGFQLNLATLPIAIVSLPTHRRRSIVPRSQDIADTLSRVLLGQHVAVDLDRRRRVRRADSEGVLILEELPPVAPFEPKPLGEVARIETSR